MVFSRTPAPGNADRLNREAAVMPDTGSEEAPEIVEHVKSNQVVLQLPVDVRSLSLVLLATLASIFMLRRHFPRRGTKRESPRWWFEDPPMASGARASSRRGSCSFLPKMRSPRRTYEPRSH